MQPTVIPFELKFRSFVMSMAMLMVVMFIIQYFMKRWTSWQNQITAWMKMKELEEVKEAETLDLGSESRKDDLPDASV
jgi:hypothetical protein